MFSMPDWTWLKISWKKMGQLNKAIKTLKEVKKTKD